MSVWLQRLVQSVRHLDIHPLAGRCDPHEPLERHTMEPWRASDRQRALAGSSWGFVCALIMVKGDWAEFGVSFGFPSWAHHANPCFLCYASGGPDGTWRETEGVSMFSSPWHAKTDEMYDAACRACENHVLIKTAGDLQLFLGHVHSPRRERTGQITTTDIPPSQYRQESACRVASDVLEFPRVGRVRSKFSSRWCSHHVMESLR